MERGGIENARSFITQPQINLLNSIHIIGGRWRGRRISFPNTKHLRPTPNRIRETLFNWLQPHIAGAHCLDLFTGSGALGLEALSRGAAHVIMVDDDKNTLLNIKNFLTELDAHEWRLAQCDVTSFLNNTQNQNNPINIVFLDPPFNKNLVTPCLNQLVQNNWLNIDAKIYIETENQATAFQLPDTLSLIQSKKAGQVSYHLAVFKSP